MELVRPFRKPDIPEVAALHCRVFGSHGGGQARLQALFQKIFFRNPWRDDTDSLVYQDKGKIIGFLGILPRRMFLNDKPIWAAVSTQFMVEPGSRSTLAALELLKALFSGAHDIAITDGANSASRKLWERLGGVTAHLYGIHWTRPLRPITYSLSSLSSNRAHLESVTTLAGPICRGLDYLTARWTPFRTRGHSLVETDLDAEQLLACIARFQADSPLRAEYDEASLDWILKLTIEKSPLRKMRMVELRDGPRAIGFFVYYLRRDLTAEVVQLNALREAAGRVLDALYRDAWRHGAIAVSGRLAPTLMQELSDRHCTFKMGSPWTLVHSSDPEVLNIICRGEASLSRLDAEWWMPFAV
jgi:hypothetical protein